MSTVFVGREPVVDDWLARRRELGQDGRDEVWEGVYHVAPHEHSRNGDTAMRLAVLLDPTARAAGLWSTGPFDLGQPRDFRVPDLGLHRTRGRELWVPTAAAVIEVLSPDDETFAKLDFYAARRRGALGRGPTGVQRPRLAAAGRCPRRDRHQRAARPGG